MEQKSSPRQGSNLSPLKRDASDVYVGLVNQAMTCYLNSLLQTLFMTPEFRHALYNWEYTGTNEEQRRSIPYQLQKLFVLLQTSVGVKTSLETKELTKSFGWDSSHAWDQHDVQELCRVMFDALELRWRRTNQATVITALYQGTMKDYVNCLECSSENARNDVFLDLPLAIKPFGSNQGFRSVEEALHGFVQHEVLDGTNQYHCEKCQKKVKAHKGLKVTRFPYLLTIQLKRFDFDYTTMHRIKLNDRMTFPDLLNLNPFVESETAPSEPSDGQSLDDHCKEKQAKHTATGDTEALDDNAMGEMQFISNNDAAESLMGATGDSDDEGICVDGTTGTANSGGGSPVEAEDDDSATSYQYDPTLVNSSIDEGLLTDYFKEGPFVYELFSIMVHSGSANGGHYYAYIKNLDTKIWYCFNDQVVTRASIEDIRKTYGGASSGPFMYSTYGSSTNAYMLMYRQFDPARNVSFPSSSKLPEHVMRMIDKVRLEEEEQRLAEEKQRSILAFKISFYHPSGDILEKEFEIQKGEFVSTLVAMAHEAFDLSSPSLEIPLELCRLVRFTRQKELLEASLDSDVTIQKAFPWAYSPTELLLEVAPWHGWFRPYATHELTLHVFIVDLEAGRVQLPKILLHATKSTTVEELKERIAELLKYDPSEITLVLDHYSRHLRLLDVPHKTLGEEDLWCQGTLFVQCGRVEPGDGAEPATPTTIEDFEKTKLYAILDQYKHTIRIKVALPSVNEYEATGFASPYQVTGSPVVVEEIGDTCVRDQASCHSEPFSNRIPADGASSVGEPKLLLPVHQQEEGSTASGSTQYATPATSRNQSPERCGVAMSPLSQGGEPTSGLTTPEMEAGTSFGGTPSPQVSPDASPISGNRTDEIADDTPDDNVPFSFDSKFAYWKSMETRLAEWPTADAGENDAAGTLDCPWEATDGHKGEDPFAAGGPPAPPPEKVDYFFDVISVQAADSPSNAPVLCIEVDRRMLLADFIQKLAPRVGVNEDQFKLYKVYPTSEYECTNSSSSSLDSLSCTNELRVKLGRPLKDGEAMVKFLKFDLNDLEVCGKLLFDIPVTKDCRIEDIRQECHVMLKRQCGLDVPVDRIRLRDAAAGYIVLCDGSTVDERRSHWSSDIYLQLLEEPEPYTTAQHTPVFVRRWCPSTMSLGPMQEIILTSSGGITEQYPGGRQLGLDFFTQLSQLSKIPLERLQCSSAMGEGAFPYECGKLKLLEEIPFFGVPAAHQRPQQSSVSTGYDMDSEGDGGKGAEEVDGSDRTNVAARAPFRFGFHSFGSIAMGIPRDGMLVYYRDKSEQQKTLSDDERKELQIRDNARLRRNQTAYSWRKERALKIYTEISSSLADELD